MIILLSLVIAPIVLALVCEMPGAEHRACKRAEREYAARWAAAKKNGVSYSMFHYGIER